MKQPKPLVDRLTPTMLERLRTRKIKNKDAAERLGVCETYLSRVVSSMQEKEPGQTTQQRSEASLLANERRHHRERLAKEVKNGQLDVAQAAERANCSERTIMRYVAAYVPTKRKPRKK